MGLAWLSLPSQVAFLVANAGVGWLLILSGSGRCKRGTGCDEVPARGDGAARSPSSFHLAMLHRILSFFIPQKWGWDKKKGLARKAKHT